MGIWIVIAAFAGLLLFPIVNAILTYKRHQGEILHIDQNRTKDPRYFGKSFSGMMRRELVHMKKGEIHLSRDEKVVQMEKADFYSLVCRDLIVAGGDIFTVSEPMTFYKEIYAKQHLCIAGDTILRSVYAEGNLILGNQIQVVRWADARGTAAVYDNCKLGISVSSAVMLTIGKNCTFQRLYAPVILFGQYPDEDKSLVPQDKHKIYRLKVQRDRERNIAYITDDMIGADGVIPFTVITRNNLVVTERLVIQGDIRSGKGVHVGEGAVICGSIFSEGDIYLDKNAWVLGNIFTQGSLIMNDRAVIGREDNISSAIARKQIRIVRTACIFGYAGCEDGGTVWPLQKDENKIRESRLSFLKNDGGTGNLNIATIEEYEDSGPHGYRHNHMLSEITLPDGVTEIRRSMFYDCRRLKKVTLPVSVTVIEDYAFAGCVNLTDINLEELIHLEEIGAHAFEDCRHLEKVRFTATVRMVGNAAFFGCRSLKDVQFEVPEHLERIGTHVFKGCPLQKEDLNLPDEKYGDSTSIFTKAEEIQEETKPKEDFDEVPWKIVSCEGFSLLASAGYPQEESRSEIDVTAAAHKSSIRLLRIKQAAYGTAAVFALTLLCTAGTWYVDSVKEQEKKDACQVSQASLYRNQGLASDMRLSENPGLITEEYVYYEDRVLKRFVCTEDELRETALLYSKIGSMIPEGIQKHSMVVPLRIQYEDSASPYASCMQEALQSFYGQLPEDISRIDLIPVLEAEKEHYIYYRTLPYWTAEGAYYGAQAFLKTIGKELPELSTYEEYMFESFTGEVFRKNRMEMGVTAEEIEKYNDKAYYYLLPEARNRADITKVSEDWKTEEITAPLISKTNLQTDIFIGGRYSKAIFAGIPQNGKTILIIGDKNADIIASYFMHDYETVYVINDIYYRGKSADFLQIFQDYNVEDVLFVEGADAFDNEVHNYSIKRIVDDYEETVEVKSTEQTAQAQAAGQTGRFEWKDENRQAQERGQAKGQ